MLNFAPSTEQFAPPTAAAESAWRRRLALCATVATLSVALSALGGFAGRWWWRFELAAHFRSQYFWCLLAGTAALLIARRYRSAILPGVLLVVHVALLWPFYAPSDTTGGGTASDSFPLRIIALNVHASNQEHKRVLQFIREQAPDAVVFAEVNERWERVLTALGDEFPYFETRARRGNFGIAFYSRIPFAACRIEELGPDNPAIVATLDYQGTHVTIFGAHPVPPVAEEVAVRVTGRVLGPDVGSDHLPVIVDLQIRNRK